MRGKRSKKRNAPGVPSTLVASAIQLAKQVDVVVRVKGDALAAANELSSMGLIVDTVLCGQNSVFGWCTESAFSVLGQLDCVDIIERN